jgi:formamidopyrimidine-DNA glycosylase
VPELPEVETICQGLNSLTLEQPIRGGEVLLPSTLAHPFLLSEFYEGITGKKILSWQRRGKYLLAELAGGGSLAVHLRMTGQLLWLKADAPLQKHTRLRIFFPQNQELRFVDIRTFGKVWYVPPNQSRDKIITGLQKLGIEPFDPNFTAEYLQQKLAKNRRKIKSVLLDQSMVAGLGNIYADEVLFKSGIFPEAIACDLTTEKIERLRSAIVEVLRRAIACGGTTISDFISVTGVNGNYGGVANVYGRTGEPCRLCGSLIERIKLGGRSTHFCPQCQTEGVRG